MGLAREPRRLFRPSRHRESGKAGRRRHPRKTLDRFLQQPFCSDEVASVPSNSARKKRQEGTRHTYNLCAMRIHPLDLAIVIVYLLGVTALGMRFRGLQQGAGATDTQSAGREYFLGGRTAPWWALAFSIVATVTSTLTIIGTPAISYAGNLTFIQLVFGYLIGRVLIVLLLLPGYIRSEIFTAYALIEKLAAEISGK